MGGSASVMARFLALAFFIVLGMAVYTFTVKTDLEAAKSKISEVEKERDTYSTRVKQYQIEAKNATASADQCKAQVTDLHAQLEAASSKKGGKR